MARTRKSKTQNPEPMTAGEAVIADPNDLHINDEENTSKEVQPNVVPTSDDEEPIDLEAEDSQPLPSEPDELPEDQKEKPKKRIPKVNTAEEAEPVPQTKEDVPPTENESNAHQLIDPSHNQQMNPKEAVAYAATQPNPKAAIDRLKKQRRLIDVTDTYALLQNT